MSSPYTAHIPVKTHGPKVFAGCPLVEGKSSFLLDNQPGILSSSDAVSDIIQGVGAIPETFGALPRKHPRYPSCFPVEQPPSIKINYVRIRAVTALRGTRIQSANSHPEVNSQNILSIKMYSLIHRALHVVSTRRRRDFSFFFHLVLVYSRLAI